MMFIYSIYIFTKKYLLDNENLLRLQSLIIIKVNLHDLCIYIKEKPELDIMYMKRKNTSRCKT